MSTVLRQYFWVMVAWVLGATCIQARQETSTVTLMAELALQRGDCVAAVETYRQALSEADIERARRTTELGLQCEHLPAASQAVQRWRKLAPRDPDAAALQTAIALKLYRIKEARDAARSLLRLESVDLNLNALAQLLLEVGEPHAVLEVIRSLRNSQQASAAELYLMAELAMNAHHLGEALRFAQLAIERDAQLFAVRRLLAEIYARQGDAERAIAAARAVQALDGKGSIFILAQTFTTLRQLEPARTELEHLRQQATGFAAEIDLRLGFLALEARNLGEARRLFEQLREVPASRDTAILHLADLDRREQRDDAALSGYRALFDTQLAVTSRARAAALLLKTGQRAAGLKLLDDYTISNPASSFELTLVKAQLLADHDEPDSGAGLLAATLARYPQHPQLRYEYAVLLERSGQVTEAVELLEELLDERPGDITLLNALGYTLADHQLRLPQAEKLIRRALAVSPDNPAFIDSLAWVRLQRGAPNEAVPLLERAHALIPDPEIAAHWGEALWRSGSRERAWEVWSRALARDPDAKVLLEVTRRFPIDAVS
jgi:predicted Zn-dependent protease